MVAFPSSTSTLHAQDLNQAWNAIRGTASNIKQRASSLNTMAAAGNIGSSSILDFATFLADAKVLLNKNTVLTGIVAYAQAQIGDPTFDVAASYTLMLAQIDATTAWIIANFPVSAGFLQAKTFVGDGTGRTQDAQFTPAQTAGLRTILAALIATID